MVSGISKFCIIPNHIFGLYLTESWYGDMFIIIMQHIFPKVEHAFLQFLILCVDNVLKRHRIASCTPRFSKMFYDSSLVVVYRTGGFSRPAAVRIGFKRFLLHSSALTFLNHVYFYSFTNVNCIPLSAQTYEGYIELWLCFAVS